LDGKLFSSDRLAEVYRRHGHTAQAERGAEGARVGDSPGSLMIFNISVLIFLVDDLTFGRDELPACWSAVAPGAGVVGVRPADRRRAQDRPASA
jgi:hypothetical protein